MTPLHLSRASPNLHSYSSPFAPESPETLPVLTFLAQGVFRFDATALIFCDCEVTRRLSVPLPGMLSPDSCNQFFWRFILSFLKDPFPLPVPIAPVTALPRFLHPGRYQVLVSVPSLTREGSKVCTQPLTLWPLPAEGVSPRRISRSAGRLRDWSECKLHDPFGFVNPQSEKRF